MTQVNLLTIEDSTIKALMIDPRTVALLPCLQTAKTLLNSTAPGGAECQRCQAEKKQIVAGAMQTAKSCITNLRGDRLAQLKTYLNARQLRLHVRNPTGGKTIYTL